jgi:small-conductance mechanosensitive channel
VNAFFAIDFSAISGTTRAFIVAGGIVLFSTLLGFIIERVLVAGLRRFAASTDIKFDDIVVSSLRGVARWGFFLLGVFAALPALPIPVSMNDEITMAGRLVILIFAIIVVGRFASGIAAHYAHRLLPSSVSLTKIIVNAVVMMFGLLIIFQTMGIKITPLLTALGVGGLAVALALQDTLANFFSGLQVLASRQVRIGDYVQLDGGHEGFVSDIGWRSATMKMLNNNMVIVPNTKLAQAIVTNYSLEERDFAVRTTIGVAYDSDLEHVERVTIEVAREVLSRIEGATTEVEPLVRYHTFGDSSIQFSVILRYHDYGAQYLAQHELVKALHKRYREEGIEIPYPIRTLIMSSTEATPPRP